MVKQYDIFRMQSGTRSGNIAYLIILQSDALSDIATAIVAPISKISPKSAFKRVNIPITVEGETFYIMMPELGAFPTKQLGMYVTNVQAVHDEVMAAIDLMFAGI